jgi:L-alanine-DL-glutamate epimerase-like enolase superfamily enzyme
VTTVPDAPVEEVTARAYRIRTDAPEADGTISWDATTMVLVEARGGGGTGVGWTYAAGAATGVVTDLLAPVVRGRGALDPPGATDAMVKAVRNVGRAGVAACAISAVDVALWDLKARLLDLPLHRLIGAVRDAVPVYGSGGFTTYDEARLEQQLGGWVHGQGIPRVKIKIGESWGTRVDRDLERIRQARSIIGGGAGLFVDANGAYTAKQAVRVAEAMEPSDVTWFEEPVSSDDLAGLALLRSLLRPDVAAGEYIWDLTDARRMLQAGAVDCLQADASRCGGITEWARVGALAQAFGVEVSGHCAPHLHAAVAASAPNLRHLEWFHDHVRIESMAFDGTLDPAGGAIHPADDRPGHGLTPKAEDLERYRIA